jgi:H+-translocating NAD(P) transhydrogenase subunit alpha
MVESMKAGSVIVDLAGEQGGNCELTVPGEVVKHNGVTIIGYTDLPSRLARQSSQLFATNLLHLLEELSPKKDGIASINMDDEMIRGATVINHGSITWPPPPPKVTAAPKTQKKAEPLPVAKHGHGAAAKKPSALKTAVMFLIAGGLFAALGFSAPTAFLSHFTVFILAVFIGYMVVWNVTPSLHTPLMSVTNAISSIIIIGALLQVSAPRTLVLILAGTAIVFTAINMFGGFWVTHRMLRMFKK